MGEKMTGMRMRVMRTPKGGILGSPGDGHTHPFILPNMWTFNDFKLTMMTNIFKNLRDRFQIPDHISIRLPEKFESATRGRPWMLACTMSCSRQD